MNSSLQNKLSEVVGTNNIAYIIKENNSFSMTGYKVLQNHNGAGLLKCAKLNYNGKIKLVYLVGNLKPLSHVVTRLGVGELNAVIFNLIHRVLEIKSNGFFRAENIELDFDKIFVDTSDDSVHLIYFPISGGMTGKISLFENEFRIVLIKLLNSFPVFNAPQFQRLCSDLSNGALPLEQILKKLQNNSNGNNGNQGNQINQNNQNNQNSQSNQRAYEVNEIKSGYQQRGIQPVQVQNQVPQPNINGYQPLAGGQQGNFGYNNGYQAQNYAPIAQSLPQPTMTINAINTPVQVILTVNTPEYLIGKNPDMVNGAVTHNPAISRVHCKISFNNGKYYITDLGSANGTCINQQRLNKHQTVELRSGDYLKLANSDFIISF